MSMCPIAEECLEDRKSKAASYILPTMCKAIFLSVFYVIIL